MSEPPASGPMLQINCEQLFIPLIESLANFDYEAQPSVSDGHEIQGQN